MNLSFPSQQLVGPLAAGKDSTHLSPWMRWRFLEGLAPGVLSRCTRCISRMRALSRASVSRADDLVASLDLLVFRRFRDFELSRCCLVSMRPRSEGGGGVARRTGEGEAALPAPATDPFPMAAVAAATASSATAALIVEGRPDCPDRGLS